MNKIITKFDEYMCSSKKHWERRFTWCGLDGTTPKNNISIFKFNKEIDMLSELTFMCGYEIKNLFGTIKRFADDYITWVKFKVENTYSEDEYKSLHNFFIGAIGELFFFTLFEFNHSIQIIDAYGKKNLYTFTHSSPTLFDGCDMGVDFTTISNNVPSVIQVKFWNPHNKKDKIGINIISKICGEGAWRFSINPNDEHNVFICYLGNEDDVYKLLKTKGGLCYRKSVVVIGKYTLKHNIEENDLFWEKFQESLNNLK